VCGEVTGSRTQKPPPRLPSGSRSGPTRASTPKGVPGGRRVRRTLTAVRTPC
jgi:hypothetical protein